MLRVSSAMARLELTEAVDTPRDGDIGEISSWPTLHSFSEQRETRKKRRERVISSRCAYKRFLQHLQSNTNDPPPGLGAYSCHENSAFRDCQLPRKERGRSHQTVRMTRTARSRRERVLIQITAASRAFAYGSSVLLPFRSADSQPDRTNER